MVIVHIEVFTLARINTGVTNWIKSGRGERYYHAGQIGFLVTSGPVCACLLFLIPSLVLAHRMSITDTQVLKTTRL